MNLLFQMPSIALGKQMFIIVNYLLVVLFVVMNLYITYQIVQAYGPVLVTLFRGDA